MDLSWAAVWLALTDTTASISPYAEKKRKKASREERTFHIVQKYEFIENKWTSRVKKN